MEYEDFSIKIEPMQGDVFPVLVMHSPAGRGHSFFRLPFDPNKLVEAATTLEQEVRTRQVLVRDASGAPVESLPQRLGEQLFSSLFSGDVLSLFDRSIGRTADQNRGLRIRLHIDPEDPTLAPLLALPWEFLYRKNLREFLNLSKFTPILRDLDVPRPSMPFELALPLRILVFASDPLDYPRLNLELEREKLDNFLSRLQGVKVDYLLNATLATLQDQLAEDNYHVLHYMGHGGFNENTGRGVLLLEDENQTAEFVDGGTLGVLLRDYPTIRLVFLNACETARLSSDKGLDPFAGVASALLMTGIPSVVAMQFPISDRAAILFSNRFYSRLVRGIPVDACVAEGRRAVRLAEPETLEWGTPVLFNTVPDGVIFTLNQPMPAEIAVAAVVQAMKSPELPVVSPEAEEQQRLEMVYMDGMDAFCLEDWAKAVLLFQQVAEARPEFQDVTAKLETARRNQETRRLYDLALEAEAAGQWLQAERMFVQVERSQPDYKDVSARLVGVRQAARLATATAQPAQAPPAGGIPSKPVTVPPERRPIPRRSLIIAGVMLLLLVALAYFGLSGSWRAILGGDGGSEEQPPAVVAATRLPTNRPASTAVEAAATKVIPTQTKKAVVAPVLAPTKTPTRRPTATTRAVIPPTATLAPVKPLFTALEPMFCREGPNQSYVERVTLNTGDTWPVLGIWSDQTWLLLGIDLSTTRTRCCWVNGDGQLNVSRSSLPIINYVPDRIACDLNP